jgi:RNA polymerase sigma factor (sigma-70 family)
VESTWEDPHPSPEQIAEQAEQRRRLWQALGLLSPAQRTAMVLRYYHELQEKEIAEIMGCAAGTVKHYLYEGRMRLRGILGSDSAPDPKGERHG